jgi:hypothetical protein
MTLSAFKLPLNAFELPFYTFGITLAGVQYFMTMRYNSRADRWFLDVADSQRTPVVTGLPLLVDRRLLQQYPTLPVPYGELIVTDDSGRDLDPTIQSFINDHSLIFLTPSAT